jgi:N-acetylglucosamine-6-phosphate deacetylase
MAATALVGARVFDGSHLLEGKAVIIDGAKIAAVVSEPDIPADAKTRCVEGLIAPGFIDTQVNGGGGALFNDAPTVATIERIGRAHRRFGTTGFLPTLISDDLSVISAAMRAVHDAIEARVPGVIGVHIEGPFISEARKGVHDAAKFRDLDDRGVQLLTSLSRGRTLVTLAPEVTTPETIRQLAQAGVVISAGHTDATFEEMDTAFRHGVRGLTHLFNAMSPLTSREPGAVGAALHHSDCWCGLIVDGKHVHPAALQIALACKRPDRFMLVTDAMPIVGSDKDFFMLQGRSLTTPPVSDDILVGITRGAVMRLALDLDLELVERSVDRTEVYQADEAFLCGTGVQVAPIVEVDGRPVGSGSPGAVTLGHQEAYFRAVLGNEPRYRHWCSPVYRITESR